MAPDLSFGCTSPRPSVTLKFTACCIPLNWPIGMIWLIESILRATHDELTKTRAYAE